MNHIAKSNNTVKQIAEHAHLSDHILVVLNDVNVEHNELFHLLEMCFFNVLESLQCECGDFFLLREQDR